MHAAKAAPKLGRCPDPVGEHEAERLLASGVGLHHDEHGRCGVEELVDPGDVGRVRGEDRERNFRFLYMCVYKVKI